MQWVIENWLLLVVAGGMVAMHLFGHRHGHKGGRKGGRNGGGHDLHDRPAQRAGMPEREATGRPGKDVDA